MRCGDRGREVPTRVGSTDGMSDTFGWTRANGLATPENVRTAVRLAREGLATKLEATATMSTHQAAAFARRLLDETLISGGPVRIRIRTEGSWVHFET